MTENSISEVDKLMRSLMKQCDRDKVDLRDKILIFANAVKWVAIKNKIDPETTEGGKIDEYRKSLESDRAGRKNTGHARRERQEKIAAASPAAPGAPSKRLTEDGSAPEEESGGRHADHSGNGLFIEDTKPPANSFPVLGGGVQPEPDGHTQP